MASDIRSPNRARRLRRHPRRPGRRRERALKSLGHRLIAGIDEAGRGPLAGPVVAAAVVLPERVRLPGVADSKRVDPGDRPRIRAEIQRVALGVGYAVVGVGLIDRMNILGATFLAMRLALERLVEVVPVDAALVDGPMTPGLTRALRPLVRHEEALVDGDDRELAIACASIVAKTTRDELMSLYDAMYEGYGFAGHKGYTTPEHLEALSRLGPCAIHRRSFAPVAERLAPNGELFHVGTRS